MYKLCGPLLPDIERNESTSVLVPIIGTEFSMQTSEVADHKQNIYPTQNKVTDFHCASEKPKCCLELL